MKNVAAYVILMLVCTGAAQLFFGEMAGYAVVILFAMVGMAAQVGDK
jgi:hypothetical protein